MVKLHKKYKAAHEVADLSQEFPLEEAVDLLNKFPKAKFDETVEVSLRLAVDPRQVRRRSIPPGARPSTQGRAQGEDRCRSRRDSLYALILHLEATCSTTNRRPTR